MEKKILDNFINSINNENLKEFKKIDLKLINKEILVLYLNYLDAFNKKKNNEIYNLLYEECNKFNKDEVDVNLICDSLEKAINI